MSSARSYSFSRCRSSAHSSASAAHAACRRTGGLSLARLALVGMALAGAALVASGCSSMGVKPWQRDLLSRQDMRPDGRRLDDAIDDHVYFSKEASSGGKSFAGGGCGCN